MDYKKKKKKMLDRVKYILLRTVSDVKRLSSVNINDTRPRPLYVKYVYEYNTRAVYFTNFELFPSFRVYEDLFSKQIFVVRVYTHTCMYNAIIYYVLVQTDRDDLLEFYNYFG